MHQPDAGCYAAATDPDLVAWNVAQRTTTLDPKTLTPISPINYFTKTFDVAALTEHSWGDLPNDRRHNLKVYGMYAFDLGVQVGGNRGNKIHRHGTGPFYRREGADAWWLHSLCIRQ